MEKLKLLNFLIALLSCFVLFFYSFGIENLNGMRHGIVSIVAIFSCLAMFDYFNIVPEAVFFRVFFNVFLTMPIMILGMIYIYFI